MSETLLTAQGFEKLNGEYVRLRAERESLAKGEFLDVRDELELLDRRLRLLEDRLLAAAVVEPVADGEVELGERVTVLDLESSETIDYRVVGAGEIDRAVGDVSYQSPIGAALLGKRVGDIVDAETPRGLRRLEIVELDG